MAVSALVSLLYFHRLVGVREGTVICALTIGFVMKQFVKVCQQPLMRFVERETKLQQAMGDMSYLLDRTGRPKLMISVSWEFGSGGYEIARELAKRLGISFYGNDELIPMEAADDSINGAGNMLRFVKGCHKGNPKLRVAGLFFNAVDMRTTTAKAYVPQMQESWKELMFKTVIPYSQDARKAEGIHEPVTEAFPNGKVAAAFRELLKEVEERVG